MAGHDPTPRSGGLPAQGNASQGGMQRESTPSQRESTPSQGEMPQGDAKQEGAVPSRWLCLEQLECLRTPIYTALQKRFRHERDGREGDFFTFQYPDWVQTVALTQAGELILVEQFRFGTEGFGWELSGGVMDAEDGGDPVVAARRELLEETGYTSAKATVIGWAHPNPALQGNRIHYVLLEDCVLAAAPSPDANEELRHRLVDWQTAQALLGSGAISHALSVCGLYAYERYLRNGLEPEAKNSLTPGSGRQPFAGGG